MDAAHLGPNASEDSSGSTGTPLHREQEQEQAEVLTVNVPDDRVRKFQKTGDHGSRLRKASGSNVVAPARLGPPDSRPLGSQRRIAKVPLGPRGPPQDFSKHR